MNSFLNVFRKIFLNRWSKKLKNSVENDLTDLFLESVLKVMKFMLYIDSDFRKNIKSFNGRYAFKSRNGKIAASAVFRRSKMKVKRTAIAEKEANITVIFRNGQALRNFLFSKNPDVMGAILNNDINTIGNLNYILKFGYMAKYLQTKYLLWLNV